MPEYMTAHGVRTALPRMRTAQGILDIIKSMDPETAINLNNIRALLRSGAIPVWCVGRKKLADADKVIDYLAGENVKLCEESKRPAGIRPVKE